MFLFLLTFFSRKTLFWCCLYLHPKESTSYHINDIQYLALKFTIFKRYQYVIEKMERDLLHLNIQTIEKWSKARDEQLMNVQTHRVTCVVWKSKDRGKKTCTVIHSAKENHCGQPFHSYTKTSMVQKFCSCISSRW